MSYHIEMTGKKEDVSACLKAIQNDKSPSAPQVPAPLLELMVSSIEQSPGESWNKTDSVAIKAFGHNGGDHEFHFKKFLAAVAPIAALLMLLFIAASGCATQSTVTSTPVVSTNSAGLVSTNVVTSTNVTRTLDINLTTNTINLVVPLAVTEAVIQDPSSRQYLADAALAINTFLGGTNYTPAALDVALNSIGSKALQNPQTIAAINSAVGLYEASYAQAVDQKLSQIDYLVPILRSLAGAITQGLANSP
jgi:hypothetical protein